MKRFYDFAALLSALCFLGQVGGYENGALTFGRALGGMLIAAGVTAAFGYLGALYKDKDAQKKDRQQEAAL